jgi:hypothetical protein
MVTLFRHRQPKGADTVKPHLSPPRHIPTLPIAAVSDDQEKDRQGNCCAAIAVDSRRSTLRNVERRSNAELKLAQCCQ